MGIAEYLQASHCNAGTIVELSNGQKPPPNFPNAAVLRAMRSLKTLENARSIAQLTLKARANNEYMMLYHRSFELQFLQVLLLLVFNHDQFRDIVTMSCVIYFVRSPAQYIFVERRKFMLQA